MGEYFRVEHRLPQCKRQGREPTNHTIGVRFCIGERVLTLKLEPWGASTKEIIAKFTGTIWLFV